MVWENKRISSSAAGHDPRIHGRYVVWQQRSGTRTTSSSMTSIPGSRPSIPRIPGSTIATSICRAARGHRGRRRLPISYVYLYDIAAGGEPQRLTTIVPSEQHPSLSMGRVVWSGFDGQDWELFLYAGGAVTQLTNNAADEREPWFDGEWVASVGNKWSVSQSDDDAAVTNINGTLSRLLRGSLHDKSIRVRGNHVVWLSGQQSSFFDHKGEVWLHDIAANITQRISPDLDSTLLQIDGGRVVWVDEAPGYYQTEIVVYYIATGHTQRLNKSNMHDNMPDLNGHELVWVTDTRVVWLHDFDTGTTEWVYDAAPPTRRWIRTSVRGTSCGSAAWVPVPSTSRAESPSPATGLPFSSPTCPRTIPTPPPSTGYAAPARSPATPTTPSGPRTRCGGPSSPR